MRFRKASRVEVFNLKEAPYGTWRAAEILSGNGHMYIVRYYSFALTNDEVIEVRVPRRVIRPCPPQIHVDRWEVGDLVEVLDNVSWKPAMVLEELPARNYVVRLDGASEELTVHKVNLRARQFWQDERWVLIGKGSCSVKSSTLTESDVHQNLKPLLNSIVPQETNVASLQLLKRSSPCESAESCTRSPKKIRDWYRFTSSSVQKRDECKGEGNKDNSRFRQMVRVRSKRFSECVGTGRLVFNGCYDTDACSVGSCSRITYDESDTATSSQDAEASKQAFGSREEPRKHSVAGSEVVRSCRPELYTYRSTLGKLFASGPLNWDLETSLTDLRFSLNISDDEHLMELRKLKSAATHS